MKVPADAIIIDSCKDEDKKKKDESAPYHLDESTELFKMPDGQVLCNESEVTGYKAFVVKGVMTYDDVKNGLYLSNVLYRNSYIIKGNCLAVVCAVGSNTQYGMAQEAHIDGTVDEEQTTPLRSLLEKHKVNVSQFTLYFVVMLILLADRFFLYRRLQGEPSQQYNILLDVNHVLPLLISSIALLIAVVPESTNLAHSVCLVNYHYLEVFNTGQIVYQSIKSMELLG